MEFIINTEDLPSQGQWYRFNQIVFKEGLSMEHMTQLLGEVPQPKLGCSLPFILFGPEVLPAEPITKPAPIKEPRPAEDDPFNVPAPKVDPTPKGFLFFKKLDL